MLLLRGDAGSMRREPTIVTRHRRQRNRRCHNLGERAQRGTSAHRTPLRLCDLDRRMAHRRRPVRNRGGHRCFRRHRRAPPGRGFRLRRPARSFDRRPVRHREPRRSRRRRLDHPTTRTSRHRIVHPIRLGLQSPFRRTAARERAGSLERHRLLRDRRHRHDSSTHSSALAYIRIGCKLLHGCWSSPR